MNNFYLDIETKHHTKHKMYLSHNIEVKDSSGNIYSQVMHEIFQTIGMNARNID